MQRIEGEKDHSMLGQFDHSCVNTQYGEAHKVFMEAHVISFDLHKRTKFRGFIIGSSSRQLKEEIDDGSLVSSSALCWQAE